MSSVEFNNFLNMLISKFDENLDPDGNNYSSAIKYAKQKGIDTKDIKEVTYALKEINNTEHILVEMLEDSSEEERIIIKPKLDYYHDINIGLISIMLDLRYNKYTA